MTEDLFGRWEQSRRKRWCDSLQACQVRVDHALPPQAEGRLRRVVGLALEAEGCLAPIGARCLVEGSQGSVETEVVGFNDGRLFLMPTETMEGVLPDARVRPLTSRAGTPVGDRLIGRVIDANGDPLDGQGPLQASERAQPRRAPINPMLRDPITVPLDVGVRSINALLTIGRGQRMGLFAGSGVGKSTLLGMMTRYTSADIVIVGLIGERGREVKEFVDHTLGNEGRQRAVIVAAPADAPPLNRLRGARLATTLAEYFRDQGKHVLLLMDSLTRYAQAQREIALAIGEPPATRGYPPSVFAMLPALVERAGNGLQGRGSITALYTVLTEGDDYRSDPVADAARAILDGHIVLSRDLAEAGHYPAIDIEASISRVMPQIISPDQLALAQRFRQIYATYQHQRDLIAVGAYQKGSDPRTDEAIALWPRLNAFLQQATEQQIQFPEARQSLHELLGARG